MPSDPPASPPPPPPPPSSVAPDYRSPLPMPANVSPSVAAGMTLDQITAIKIADVRSKKIRRVANVAYGDAFITGFFALCTLCPCAWSVDGCLLGIGLAFVAFVSFRNARAVQKFDVSAPRRLALNQIVLALCIILYALAELYKNTHGGGIAASIASSLGSSPEMAQAGIDPKDIEKQLAEYGWIAWAIYGGLVGGTIFAQSLTAAYYFSRTHIIEEFLEITPKWVVDFRKNIPR